MALTLTHLRTLSVEELETLRRLHGDTLTDAEKEALDKAIAEKRDGSAESEQEQEGEQEQEQERESEGESEGESEQGPPSWWKDPPTADEVADRLLEKFAEAESIADNATGESEGEGESGSGESQAEGEKKEESSENGAGKKGEEQKDNAPQDEHWFYRGRRRKVTNE